MKPSPRSLARDAIVSALVSIELCHYAEAMALVLIAAVHLSHVVSRKELERIVEVAKSMNEGAR